MRASTRFVSILALAGTVATGGALGAPRVAYADDDSDPNAARADELFKEGRELMKNGQNAEACPKFEEGQKLRPGIGMLYNLADCHEKTGKLVDAYTEFQEVVDRTKAAFDTEREKAAEDRVAALQLKIAKLVITIPSTNAHVSVALDNVILTPDRIGVPLVVTAGAHEIKATTDHDNGEPYDANVNVAGNGATTTVTIPVAPGAKMARNTGVLVAGGVLTGVGIIGLLAGVGIIAVDVSSPDQSLLPIGGGVALVGVVCMAIGIPLIAVGAKKHPVVASYKPEAPSPIPDVRIGGSFIGGGSAMAKFTWHF